MSTKHCFNCGEMVTFAETVAMGSRVLCVCQSPACQRAAYHEPHPVDEAAGNSAFESFLYRRPVFAGPPPAVPTRADWQHILRDVYVAAWLSAWTAALKSTLGQ